MVLSTACSTRPLEEALPTDLGLSDDEGLHLVWINSTSDCLNCQDLDYRLRRIQARWGENLAFTLAHLGSEEDESIAQGFLRQVRLRGEVVSVAPDLVASYRPQISTPALVLLIDGALAWNSMEAAHLPRPIDDLEERIASALPETGTLPAETDSIAYADELLLWVPDRAPTPTRALVGRLGRCLRIMTEDPALGGGVPGMRMRIVAPEEISKAARVPEDEGASPVADDATLSFDDVAWWSDERWAAIVGQIERCGGP